MGITNLSIWPLGAFIQRVNRIIHNPTDIWLLLRIAHFLWRSPSRMEQLSLPSLLAEISTLSRPTAPNVASSAKRIVRLRSLLLRQPYLRSRNTCYLRALTLYRFLHAPGKNVCIHYGVEIRDGDIQPHGHAWITVDRKILEAPELVAMGKIREIFHFPPVSTQ